LGHGRRLRIGLLVPSSNTTMEPEFYRMAPEGVSIHTARMRLEEVTPGKLIEMAGEAERAAGLLATAEVDVMIFGCTTGSLIGGVEWEKGLVNGIEQRTGSPTVSTGRAVVDAINALGGGSIAVATPYTDDLNALERTFLEAHGIEVVAIKGLGLVRNLNIGRTESSAVETLVRTIAGGADLVFISCTNLPTIGLINGIESELGIPVVTSNQASMWAAMRGSGVTRIEGYGVLLLSID
jgi:maleate isomerase